MNALVPMQLAHEYGRTMAKRNRGGIILVASTVGHQAAPYLATTPPPRPTSPPWAKP